MLACALISLATCTVGADIEAADSILRSLERSADDESTSVLRPRAERCPPPLMQLALDDAWDAHAVDYSDLDSYTPNPVRSIGSIDLRTGRHRAFFEELRGGIMAHSRTPRRAVDRGEWLAPEQFASTDAQCRAARPHASAGCDRALFPLGGAVLSEEVHCFQPVPWPARPPSCAFKRYTLRELRALTAKRRIWIHGDSTIQYIASFLHDDVFHGDDTDGAAKQEMTQWNGVDFTGCCAAKAPPRSRSALLRGAAPEAQRAPEAKSSPREVEKTGFWLANEAPPSGVVWGHDTQRNFDEADVAVINLAGLWTLGAQEDPSAPEPTLRQHRLAMVTAKWEKARAAHRVKIRDFYLGEGPTFRVGACRAFRSEAARRRAKPMLLLHTLTNAVWNTKLHVAAGERPLFYNQWIRELNAFEVNATVSLLRENNCAALLDQVVFVDMFSLTNEYPQCSDGRHYTANGFMVSGPE